MEITKDEFPIINLIGEVEFYPHLFYYSSQGTNNIPKPELVSIPSYWNFYNIGNTNFQGHNYGTFRFRISLPESHSNYGMVIPTIGTAYRIYINNQLKAQVGVPGTNRTSTVSDYHPKLIKLTPKSNQLEIIIHVANFKHSRGGIWEQIQFGQYEHLSYAWDQQIITEALIIGIFFIMMIYHFILFIIRRNNFSALFFGLACLGLILRTSSMGLYLIHLISPEIPWWLMTKMEYFSIHLTVFALVAFQETLFGKEMNKIINRVIYGLTIISSLIIVFTNINIYSYTFWSFIGIAGFASIYTMICLLISGFNKRRMALLLFGGYFIYFLAFVNDILFANSILLSFGWLIYTAQLFLIIIQSIIIADHFNLTLNKVEELTNHLENKVKERTRELLYEINERKKIEHELRHGEQRLGSILQNSPHSILISSSLTGEVLFANRKTLETLKVSLSEIFDYKLQNFFYKAEECDFLIELVITSQKIQEMEVRMKTSSGNMFWGNISAIIMDYAGEKAILSIFRDITLSKLNRAEIELQRAYLESLFESINEAVVILDTEGMVDRVNSQFTHLFGYTYDELASNKIIDFITNDQYREEATQINSASSNGETIIIDTKRKHKDGSLLDVSLMSAPIIMQKQQIGVYELYRDIRLRKQQEQQLKESLATIRELSLTDELTGCYNRRGFLLLAEEQVKLSERSKNPMLLLFMDLDGLKWINDNLGHKIGDQAIKDAADLLHYTFRKPDIIARIGGDEFIALIIDASINNIDVIQNRLNKNLSILRVKRKETYYFDASFGFEEFNPEHAQAVEDVIKLADAKMYENKRKKKNNREHDR